MQIGDWYEQRFSDEVLYFLPLSEQKNGGYSGMQVAVDLLRPRARPRAKKSSVRSGRYGSAAHWSVLWREARDVPDAVLEAAGPSTRTGRDRASRWTSPLSRRPDRRTTARDPGDLTAVEVERLPVGTIVAIRDSYLAVVPDGLVPITILSERASAHVPRGEPAAQWGERGFEVVAEGRGRLLTNATAQRKAEEHFARARRGGRDRARRDPASRGTSRSRTARAAPRPFVMKPGKHGTLHLFRVGYRGEEDDPGAPVLASKIWAYSADHAAEKFYDGADLEGWYVTSIDKVREA